MVTGRIRKEFTRPENKRDSKLIVIATEGRVTERLYFEELANFYDSSRVHVEVIEKLDNNSSPAEVLYQLNEFAKTYKLDANDELWMIIDRDYQSWGEKMLKAVAKECRQKRGYFMGVSNPAFEIWLLLHLIDFSTLSLKEKSDLFANRKVSVNKTFTKKKLSDLLNGYNESSYDPKVFMPHVKNAIVQAKTLDNTALRWPNTLGTRVYEVVEKIIKL